MIWRFFGGYSQSKKTFRDLSYLPQRGVKRKKLFRIYFYSSQYLLAVDTKKSPEASSQNHIKKPLSCDTALSVFDGITVKVHYIGEEQQASAMGSESDTNSAGKAATLSKNGVINSSKELLLGLEEKRKKEVTTVPLRQPLCANYKSIVTSTTRQNSFMGKIEIFPFSYKRIVCLRIHRIA